MKAYGWSAEHVRKRITGAQGWAYYFWAIQHESTMFGGGLEIVNGYIAGEIERIKNERRTKCKS